MEFYGNICVLVMLILTGVKGENRLMVEVDDHGSYRLNIDGEAWLVGAPPYFYVDGTRYSVDDGSLEFLNVSESFGSGPGTLPNYVSKDIYYRANETEIVASARQYNDYIIFMVRYADGANGTHGYNEWEIIGGFPGFEMDDDLIPLGYLTFSNRFIGSDNIFGRWNKTAYIPDSLEGSGPIALFDKADRSLVISPADNFMSSSSLRDKTNNRLYWGIMGGVNSVPENFTYSTIVSFSGYGIRRNFDMWGFLLRQYIYWNDTSNRPRFAHPDTSIAYLGYWTSPGSVYHSQPENGKTYEQTLTDVFKASVENNIPYSYAQLDDWWCIKSGDNIKEWIPSPTNLPNGLQSLHNSTGLEFVAYAGLWSTDNVYAKQNGGVYDFIMENGIALPHDQKFWDDLFLHAKSLGISTFEQDKMSEAFLSMNSTKTDLYLASDWLNQMDSAAYKNNITIIYNDAYPRQILHTVVNQAVTQVRVSDDYGRDSDQWRIGVKSLLVESLQLKPGKGVFKTKTTTKQREFSEPNPALQEVVALLSGGSVGIGDALGSTDTDLLKRCCGSDGRLLHPRIAARAIDNQIIQAAFQDGSGPTGEVWSTYTTVQTNTMDSIEYGIIFAYELRGQFIATPISTNLANSEGQFPNSKIYSIRSPKIFHNFNESFPLVLDDCLKDFCLYHTAPIITHRTAEFVILGELSKWIPMAVNRVKRISIDDVISVTVQGAPNELINLSVLINDVLVLSPIQTDKNGEGAVIFTSGTSPATALTTVPTDQSNHILHLSVLMLLSISYLVFVVKRFV